MRTAALITIVAVVAGIAGIAVVARDRSRRPVGLRSVLVGLAAAAVVTGVGCAVVIVVWRGRTVKIDMVLHQLYLVLTVTIPLLAAGTLVLGVRRGSSLGARVAGVVLLLPAVVGAYATHVEPYWLRVDRHRVAVAPARGGDEPVRIGVLADLQTNQLGEHERRAIDEVLAAEPDLILVPGDLFQGRTYQLLDQLPDLRREIGRLHAPAGVFFVRGDVDKGRVDRTTAILDGLDITVLDDEVVDVEVGDRVLRIGGTRLDYASEAAQEVRDELLATPEDGPVTILLSHRPDTVLELPADSRVDLTVAGHTHGGQVVLPGIGPLIVNTGVPRDAARGGLHSVDGNTLYVGPGVGMARGEAPQVRFLSRPAVAVLTLADG